MGTNVWNEMSYRRYMNRKYEYETQNNECVENDNVRYYGLYEDLCKKNILSVEDIFYLNYEE